jgi:lipid II:glycine glycyltransferase (peptidoglycan interpeptide bridge formation enzyme)
MNIEKLIASFEESENKRTNIKNIRLFRKAQKKGVKTRNRDRELKDIFKNKE